MTILNVINSTLICLVAVSALLSSSQKEAIHNERVIVGEITIAPGEVIESRGINPVVLVYFTDATLEISGVDGKPSTASFKRGATIFEKTQPRRTKNSGSAMVRIAQIELLSAGRNETWGNTGLSPKYKMILENEYVRVYEIRIAAGTREPQHTHRDRVVVCLSGAQMKHLMTDGREENSTLNTGQLDWRLGSTHIGQNMGHTDLWVMAVEPK